MATHLNEKLDGYIRRKRLTNKFFADRINVLIEGKPISERTVENWRLGISVPRKRALEAIFKESHGELTPNDFVRFGS